MRPGHSAFAEQTTVTMPGPVLVYSKVAGDLPRFKQLLSEALPEAVFRYAASVNDAASYLNDTEIFYGWGFPPELPLRMPKLRWLQKMGAGVDDILPQWPPDHSILLTRTDGAAIAPRMVEYVVGAILDQSIGFNRARRQQEHRLWEYYEVGTVRGLTVGVAGLGAIGGSIAAALKALGAKTVGWRRSVANAPCIDELFTGQAALPEFLARCDVIVLVLPLTKETGQLINAQSLQHCRPDAHLINIGRGGLIDEADLLVALEAGRIGHATLDVFATEPLPENHPFWNHSRVTVTPHVSGPLIPEDVAPHFVANYRAFAAGKPLRNIIDIDRQY